LRLSHSDRPRGTSRAYLRLRIVSTVTVVAIAVTIALPGTFPLWMKIEQGFCGLLLLGVVFLANGKLMRSMFATGWRGVGRDGQHELG
jgi:hypothetical protein